MKLLELRLIDQDDNCVRNKEVIDLNDESSKDSYLLNKLLSWYEGDDEQLDTYNALWRLKLSIRDRKFIFSSFIDLESYILDITIIDEKFISEFIASHYSIPVHDINEMIKIGDIVIDLFYALNENKAKSLYLDRYGDDNKNVTSCDFIQVTTSYCISVRKINFKKFATK